MIAAIRDYEAAVDAAEDNAAKGIEDDGMAIADALSRMDELNAWSFEAKVKEILDKAEYSPPTAACRQLKWRTKKACSTCPNTH